jgi:ABC-type uncharacterized transport system YnjBCD ATPase subunit
MATKVHAAFSIMTLSGAILVGEKPAKLLAAFSRSIKMKYRQPIVFAALYITTRLVFRFHLCHTVK